MIIKGYSLPLVQSLSYQEHWPNRNPYPHQAKVFESWHEEDAFLVSTRTGSGKTITAAFPTIANKESAVFLYPTNALLEDQVKSIHKLMNDLHIKAYIRDGKSPWNAAEYSQSDYVIIVMNSTTLEDMRKQRGLKTKGDLVVELLLDEKPILVITNPDAMFLLAAGRFKQSFKAFAILQKCSTLVVDEFHLYSGLELSNLFFLIYYMRELKLYKRLVLLSATPSEETAKLIYQLFNTKHVTDDVGDYRVLDTRKTVHDLACALVQVEDSSLLVESIAKEIRNRLTQIQSMPPASDENPVPVVVIVDSVIQAIMLEDELMGMGFDISDIASYRGLLNPRFRRITGTKIVVGTSAIEVGIDFDCQWLLFTAMDAASFLQRLGRAGRHAPGRVTLFAKSAVTASMSHLSESITRSELEQWVQDRYPDRDDMSWFASTGIGVRSARVIVEAGMDKASRDWTLLPSEHEEIQVALTSTFHDYLDQFAGYMDDKVRNLIKRVVKYEWTDAYIKSATFRSSSFSVAKVKSYREQRIGREQEAGNFQDSLYRVLAQGCNIKYDVYKEGLHVCVDGFGKSKPVYFTEVGRMSADNKLRVLNSKFSFDVGNISLSHELLKETSVVYVRLPREQLPSSLDWRIEVWKDAYYPSHVVAFGGHALLLKALYERAQRKKS